MTLQAGDVIVHPAGTGHSNMLEEGDYRYLAFFPTVSQPPHRHDSQVPTKVEGWEPLLTFVLGIAAPQVTQGRYAS
jgi:hypothetical protein